MRVHDLAAEFGVTSDELVATLREMDIHVRSHLSSLEDDKVSRVRARFEREKRKDKQAGTPAKGRRRTAKATVEEAAKKAEPVETAKPKRRRRTAAEVAVQEAEQAAVAAAEAAANPPPVVALFKDEPEVEEEPGLVEADLFPPELQPRTRPTRSRRRRRAASQSWRRTRPQWTPRPRPMHPRHPRCRSPARPPLRPSTPRP
jgi:translation initiation factor IF-2